MTFQQKAIISLLITVFLFLTLLTGCASKTLILTTTPTLTKPPILLAEWKMGNITDMAWSTDSKIFAVNYWIDNNNSDNYVQAFDVNALKSIWVANNSLAADLIFTPNQSQIAETNEVGGNLYLRDTKQGNVVREIKSENCGGGWFAIANSPKDTIIVADTNRFIGLNADSAAIISQWDLKTGQCKKLLQYYGGFDIFDVNFKGNLLAYGGEGKDAAVVIWDIEKQAEVCRTGKVDFGRFIPQQNILAVIRGQKMVFLDTSSCQEIRELAISTRGTYLAFSPDGQQFVVATDSIKIMKVSTGEILSKIPYPKNTVLYDQKLFSGGIEFSPDGRYLIIAFLATDIYSGKIQLWQVQ